jgi:lipopolysaccharide export system protein LptA
MARFGDNEQSSRRALLRGIVTAAVAGLAARGIKSDPAEAADGASMLLGRRNFSHFTTQVKSTRNRTALKANSDTDDAALVGENSSRQEGSGVRGSGPYIGVTGVGAAVGVMAEGSAESSIGMVARGGPRGAALHCDGVVKFSRSGKLTVPAGRVHVTQHGIALKADSLVIATLQENKGRLRAAVPNVAEGSFTVHLAEPVNSDTTVAWIVIN